jgi:putative hydrolase of the HAD superfamily
MQLKAIIFDYGGVLCFHPPEQQVRELAALCRLTYDQFLAGYWSLRAAYDRGDIERDDYWSRIGKPGGHAYTGPEIENFSRGDVQFWVHLDRRMMDWARQIRASGLRIGLLSNLPQPLGEHLRDEMRLTAGFDHHSFSYELRAAKPEAAIYRHALEGLGVEPGEALFLDDRPENVEGARAVGIRAIQFETPGKLKQQLDELFGNSRTTGDGQAPSWGAAKSELPLSL